MAILLVELCSIFAVIASAGVYEGVSHFRTFDIMLRGRADSLLGAVQDAEDPQDNVMLDGTQLAAPRRDIYAVRDELGRMLGHSPNWPDPEGSFADEREFRKISANGRSYRVIRVPGLRMVDPGDKGGGIARHVVILYGAPTHPVWESIGHAILFYSLIGLVVLAISGGMMLRILRHGLEPLHELARQAAQVSVASWGFAPSNSVRQVRELAPLVSALESALAGLERSFSQQSQFVSDAAHELKTSVAVVKSSLQVLTMRSRSAEEYRAGVERAERDCERMEELVASMLTLASLESATSSGDVKAEAELDDIVRDIFEHFRTKAELSGVALTLQADGPVWVCGEPEQLRLLCSNLIHNALDHSPRGSEIRVAVRRPDPTRRWAQLCVEDDGEGIAQESLPHVFDRFYRGDVSRSRQTGGTGLGLAIVKAIVESLGGQVWIESEVGRGTRVFVDLVAMPAKDGIGVASQIDAPLQVDLS